MPFVSGQIVPMVTEGNMSCDLVTRFVTRFLAVTSSRIDEGCQVLSNTF